ATITINGGTWDQTQGATKIRVGSSGDNPIGTVTVNSGTMSLKSTSSNNFNMTTLNINNGGTVDMQSGAADTLVVAGTITVDSTSTLKTGRGIDFNTGASTGTVNGTFQINTGGFVSNSHPPNYGSSSLLKYNAGGTYGRGSEWSATSGAGFPNNVQVSNNTTLDMGANSGTGIARQMAGTLTIDTSSTFEMAGTNAMTAAITVSKNVINNGTLRLSTANGGDLKVGGNWTRAGTFTPNGRAVFFNGAGTQTVTVSGGGIETFDYLIVDKASGNLTFSSSPATNVIVTGPSGGSALQIVNAGGIDLGNSNNGLTLNGAVAGTNILVGGSAAPATRTITGTGTFAITGGDKSVTNNNSKTLTFDTGVNVSIFKGVDFGASLTNINGTLTLGSGGFVNTNAPTYGSASTLTYDCTCVHGRGTQWSTTSGPGYPNDVQVNTGTHVDIGNMTPNVARQIAGSLDAKSGGRFLMVLDGPPFHAMTAALTITKNVLIESGGSLNLSTSSGGDLVPQGNFTNNGTFNANNRAVFFTGGNTQTLADGSGTATLPYVVVNKSGGTVQLNSNTTTLGPSGGNSISFSTATSTVT